MKVEILYIGNDIAKSVVVGGPYIKRVMMIEC